MANMRFLIFQCNGNMMEKIKSVISESGFDVVCEKNVDKLLESARSGDFHVIIIDITVRGTNGVGMLKTIVETGNQEWIIALTDDKRKEIAQKEIGSEECAFLNKPIVMNDLKLLIENFSEVRSLRSEVTEKDKRVLRLEVINEIAREALLTRDENSLLWKVAKLIHEKLSYFNVSIFITDELENRIVLRAFAGGFGADLVVGYSLNIGEGIVGWVAQNHEPLLAGDVRIEPRRIKGFAFEENVFSELGVPIIFNDRVLGVFHVESKELNAFSRNDVMVLKTVADQMALALENRRLSGELLDAYELSFAVNDSLPVSIVLVDQNSIIRYVNLTYCAITGASRENMMNQPIMNFFSAELMEKLDFTHQLNTVFGTGIPVCHTNIHHISPFHPDKVLNISLVRVRAGKYPRVMVLIQDVTDFSMKTRQLSLIREISIAMQGVFERDKLLHMILTSVTAGFAMGFNRAFLFLLDRESKILKGSMGVGPTSREEAYRIWNELSSRSFTFEDYMENVNAGEMVRSGLQDLVEVMEFDLNTTSNILTETLKSKKFIHVVDAWQNPGVDMEMRKLLASQEFVATPLIVKNETIGVLFADNAYSGNPIMNDSIEELGMFAATAALAIENAHMLEMLENQVKELEDAYIKLEQTHDMLIRHEKLAAIGEVSTRLAHEIRNPLATIGGFAKSIPRKYDDRERTIRNAEIIVEEVQRLENILSNVLDFTKAGTPQKTENDTNDLVRETVKVMEGAAIEKNVIVVLELAQESFIAEFDAPQIKQVLINLIQNAFNAMPDGGALQIKTSRVENWIRIEIKDTGKGIPEELLDNIFDPFFTTRNDGTGLGLSISQRIVQNHNGKLDIKSIEGEGTTVSVLLPAGI